MKSKLSFLFMGLFVLGSVLSQAQKKSSNLSFFAEADAVNWVYVLKNKTLAPTDVFKMSQGTLLVTGVSSGYLRTKKAYTDYTLDIEWRWTKSFGNSGVLVHIQPKDTIWPVCYQVQQKADAAGDIICMNGLWAKECTDSVKFTVPKLLSTNEKALNEWNTMRIISKKNSLKVYINGVVQNNISGLTANKGYIGFQSEGIPLEFRKLSIK